MASPSTIGFVEVLEPADRAYYRAQLIDVDGKEYCVKYIGEDELCWVESSRVRQVPVAMTPEEHAKWAETVFEGAAVEAGFDDETIEGLTSWSEGVVQKIKGEFYVITFPESNDLEANEVVEKSKIRPAYGHQIAKFDKKVFPVPPELQEDIQLTEDLLPMMAKNAGLFVLQLSSDGSELMALGSAFALDTAFVLINMHFVKAPQLAKFAHRANSLQSRMSDSNGSMMKGESVVFNTPQAYVGTMIGYRGSNIKRVQEMEGIIRVDVRNDGVQSSVTIVATDKEKAEAARASLEVVAEEVEVEEWEVGWIIGKKGQTINEMQGMSGCRISVTNKGEKPVVELVGIKTCVDKGKALVAYTVESAQDQRQKEVMIHKLSGELRSMGVGEAGGGTTISKGRGRGRSMGGDVISFPGSAATVEKDVASTTATSPSVQATSAATPVPSSLPTRGRGRGAGKPATATATPAAPPTSEPSTAAVTTSTLEASTLPTRGRGGALLAGAGRGRAVTAPRNPPAGSAGPDAAAQSSAGAGATAPSQADPPQVRGDLAVQFVGGGMTVLPGMAIGGVPMMATGIFVPDGASLEGVMGASAGRGRGRGRSMADPGKAAGVGKGVSGGEAAGQGGADSGGVEEDKAGKAKKKKKDKGKKEAFEDAVEPGQEGNQAVGGDAPEGAKGAASKPKQQQRKGKGGDQQPQGQADAGAAGGEVQPSEEQGQPTEAFTVTGGGGAKQKKKQGKGKSTEQQSQPESGAVPPQPGAVDQDAAAAAAAAAAKKAAAAEKAAAAAAKNTANQKAAAAAQKAATAAEKAAAAAAKNTANQKAAAAAQKAAAAAAKEVAKAKDVGGDEHVEEKQVGGKAGNAKPQKNKGKGGDVTVVASTGENGDGDAKIVGGGSEKKEGKGKGKGKGKGGAAAKQDKGGKPQPVKEDGSSSETLKQEGQPSGGSDAPSSAPAPAPTRAAPATSSSPAPVQESAAPAQ